MGSVELLNSLASQAGVKAAYYEKPADLIIQATENFIKYIDPYFIPLENKIYERFPSVAVSVSEFINQHASPYTKFLPLMRPGQVLIVAILYLLAVFGGTFLTQFLPRFEVKLFSLFHNFCMVSISLYMFLSISLQALVDGYVLFGNPLTQSPAGIPMAKILWVFYISKIPEFVDTMIMVLKQNYRQISFLHVYHHCSIFIIQWLVMLTGPGGDTYFSSAFNSYIHVIMYGYYFLSAIGVKSVSFVKRFITMGQMIQFLFNFVQASYNIIGYHFDPKSHYRGGYYPHFLSIILFFYMITMLILFANFYIQDRIRAAKVKKENQKKKY